MRWTKNLDIIILYYPLNVEYWLPVVTFSYGISDVFLSIQAIYLFINFTTAGERLFLKTKEKSKDIMIADTNDNL